MVIMLNIVTQTPLTRLFRTRHKIAQQALTKHYDTFRTNIQSF